MYVVFSAVVAAFAITALELVVVGLMFVNKIS